MNLSTGTNAMHANKIRYGRIVRYNAYAKYGFIREEDGTEHFFLMSWAVLARWADESPALSTVPERTEPLLNARVIFCVRQDDPSKERSQASPWGYEPLKRAAPRRLPVVPTHLLRVPDARDRVNTLLVQKSAGDTQILRGLLQLRAAFSEEYVRLLCELLLTGPELLADFQRYQTQSGDPVLSWVEYARRLARDNAAKIIGPKSCELPLETRLSTWAASFKEGVPADEALAALYFENSKVLFQYRRACTGCRMNTCKHYRPGSKESDRAHRERRKQQG